ncbi:hypothetical protein LINPERHAP1_LOCUS19415 [Linum perenne]
MGRCGCRRRVARYRVGFSILGENGETRKKLVMLMYLRRVMIDTIKSKTRRRLVSATTVPPNSESPRTLLDSPWLCLSTRRAAAAMDLRNQAVIWVMI